MFLSAMASKLGVEIPKKGEHKICTDNEKMYIFLKHFIYTVYIYVCFFLVGQNQQRINEKEKSIDACCGDAIKNNLFQTFKKILCKSP